MPWTDQGGDGSPPPNNPWGNPGRPSGDPHRRHDFDSLFKRAQKQFGGTPGKMPWMIVAGVLFVFWILGSSTYRIYEGEVGVIQRFGRYVRSEPPGLKFKLPAPLETLTKVKTTEVKSLDIGSSGENASNDNLVLTADQNIVDVAYTVRWNIKDPKDYLFRLEDPEGTVREVSESAMREAMSLTKMDDANGLQRGLVASHVQRRAQEVLDYYKSGVRIVGVFIRQVDPPAAAVSAFRDVTTAQQDAYTYTNQANAYRQQLIANAQGDAARFNAVYQQYKLAPDVTRRRIYLETLESVLGGTQKIVVDTKGAVPYLPLPSLTPSSGVPAEKERP